MRWQYLSVGLGAIALSTVAALARAETPAATEPVAATTRTPAEQAEGRQELESTAAGPELIGQVAGEAIAVAEATQLPEYAPTVRLQVEIVTDWTFSR